jgi:glycosyltransferase involved in cell wall biosynthesis
MERLRIVLLTETFHPEIGGGERQARLLSNALVRRGHEVTIITRRSRRQLPRDQMEGGVRVVRLAPAGEGRWKKWGLVLTPLRLLPGLCASADVVFVSGFRILGLPAVIAARARGSVCVLKADSLGEMSGEFFGPGLARLGLTPSSAAVRPLIRARNAVLRRADAFVAISSEIAGELEATGVPGRHVYTLPNGVDTAKFAPADAAERAALRGRLRLPDGPLAVFTGRLVTYKGLPRLLQAWRELRSSGGAGTLVLVGAGGSDLHNCEHELRDYAERHHFRDSLIFAGPVENVEDYLRAADAFVFPTENEAFGVSLLEAMACGLPAIATPVGGIRDFVTHGHNGLLVEPGNVQQLREALATALSGGDRVAALGRAARATVLARFSDEAVADGYLALFATLRDRALRLAS